MSFKIYTDTSCNLPLKRLNEIDVKIIPFSFYPQDDTTNLRTCTAVEDFDGHAYYEEIRGGRLYNTSQINPQTFIDHLISDVRAGNDILFISMSGGISGSYRSSVLAKEALEEKFPDRRFYCLDTKAASLGEGLAVLKAAELRDSGYSISDCYIELEEFCKTIYQVFTVDDLKHLQRTGRISNTARIVGTVFGIKPILKGNELGKIVSYENARGRKNALNVLLRQYTELVKDAPNQIVGIAHADNEKDAALLAEMINSAAAPKEIITVCYEPVTGAHVGSGTIALFFTGDEEVRYK